MWSCTGSSTLEAILGSAEPQLFVIRPLVPDLALLVIYSDAYDSEPDQETHEQEMTVLSSDQSRLEANEEGLIVDWFACRCRLFSGKGS